MEADLASQYQGPDADLRNLFRPGSGLTWRRLGVLIRGLPAEAMVWRLLEAEYQKSLKPTPERIRDRAKHYQRLAEEAT